MGAKLLILLGGGRPGGTAKSVQNNCKMAFRGAIKAHFDPKMPRINQRFAPRFLSVFSLKICILAELYQ